LIPAAYIQAWRAKAPWPDALQVEQDLIICRALCDLFNAPALKGKLAFRGGTAINKLLFKRPLRYSEDIDLVQVYAEPIGAAVHAICDVLSWQRRSEARRVFRHPTPHHNRRSSFAHPQANRHQ
jgi:predicted nucleotidyltransferase component of viral defense system